MNANRLRCALVALSFLCASAPTITQARTAETTLKLTRGVTRAGFTLDARGKLSVDGVKLSEPEGDVSVDAYNVEIYPSPDGRIFFIVFGDKDGQNQARVYDRNRRQAGPYEAVAGFDRIEWSPTSKHLMVISQYEGQFLRVYDVERRTFSGLADISGRGTDRNNECVGRTPATNWAFAGGVNWNWAVWFEVDEYEAKSRIEEGQVVSSCYVDKVKDRKLRRLRLLLPLDGSTQQIGMIVLPPRPPGK